MKIPQQLQPILNLSPNTLICNPCHLAIDRDKENKQFSDYQLPIQQVPIVNSDYSYILRSDFKELKTAYYEVCEEFDRIKLSITKIL